MKEHALYINTYANRTQHEMFNRILLKALMLHFTVSVYSGKSSWKKMKEELGENTFQNTKIRTFFLPEGASAFPNLIRYVLSAIYNIGILLSSKKKDILIYNFNNPLSIATINALNVLLKRKIIVFCHGELELLITNEGGALAKLLRFFVRRFFLNKKRLLHLQFCVLGDVIIQNLKPIIGDKTNNFFSIDHPYEFENNNPSNSKNLNQILKIGTVGTLSKFKGLDHFLELAKSIKVQNLNVNLSVVGSVTDKKEEFENLGVQIHGKGELLKREDFDREIANLDYILFFYANDKYKVTASGAVFDAIKWRKPIIALKNDYFSYLFEKYGTIGFLCENISEMEQNIKLCLENQKLYTFDNYLEKLSTEEFSRCLYKKLKAKNI
ncbi:MAG: glycosyltransferase family 1 protein [Capnocytophaga sp.]|nr:glycosyltransferase family 1 protein [Capnocytophaga sp.]